MRVTGLPPTMPLLPENQPAQPPKEPVVMDEEGHARSKRGLFSNLFRRPPASLPRAPSVASNRPPSIPGSPKPPARSPADRFKDAAGKITGQQSGTGRVPSQSHPAPKNLAEVTQNLMVADRLHKAGVFPTSPQLGTVARDAFVNAGINGLVSAPMSIATYAGSTWTGEAIKGQYAAQTPLLPPVHQPAPSTQVAGGAPTVGVESQLALAELRIEVVANNIMAVREGTDAPALHMSENASGSTAERLSTLEKLYDAAEKQLALIGDENDMIFRPYKPDSSVVANTEQGRLDNLGKRFEAVNKFLGKLIVLKATELPQTAPATSQTA